MHAVIKQIVAMLKAGQPQHQHAAAVVLGHLGVKQEGVITALIDCLQQPDRSLQVAAIEALAALKAQQVANKLAPLIDAADEEVSSRAAALLATQSPHALLQLLPGLSHGSPLQRRTVVGLLARTHRKAHFERLVACLADEALAEPIVHSLRAEIEHMAPEQLAELSAILVAQLKHKDLRDAPAQLAQLIKLLGYQRDAKLVATILPYASAPHPAALRLAAIAALRRPLSQARHSDAAYLNLLQAANDADPAVARAVIETIRRLRAPAEARGALVALTEGHHAEARAYAVEALGEMGTKTAVRTLAQHLKGDDPAARQAALKALSRVEGGPEAMVRELSDALDQPEAMARLVRLLLPVAAQLKPAAQRTILEASRRALQEDRPTIDPMLRLLRAVDPRALHTLLTDLAQGHRKAKRHAACVSVLRYLQQAGLLEDEQAYLALAAGLATVENKASLGRASRSTDAVLQFAVFLVKRGFAVGRRLIRERCLSPEDLFFVGFNFSESKDDDEQELGTELLTHLATQAPRSKLGRSAKNKLKLIGAR